MNRFKKLLQKQKNTQGAKASSRSLSSGQLTESPDTESQETNPLPDLPSSTVCTSLEDITLDNWIICACDGDFSPLIRTGEPSSTELYEAWTQLVSDYQELTASKEALKNIELSAKIEGLNTKIIVVTSILEVLGAERSEELIQELKEWGYNLKYTEESFSSDLQKVAAKLGSDKTRLAMAMKSYEDSKDLKEKEGSATPTKESYMQLLEQMEDHKKRELDPSTLNMYKFGLYYKSLVRHHNLIKVKTNTNG